MANPIKYIYGTDLGETLNGDANGTSDDIIYGYGGDDTLNGGAGNDTLGGGYGNDILNGGTGDDIYYPDNANDKVVEYAGEGYDIVYVSFTYVLPDNVEGLALQGTVNINGTGNGLNNILYGNDSNNALYGLGGNDILHGYGGNDTLDGGAGGDILYGGVGNDLLYGNDGNDALYGGNDNDTMYGGAGNDTMYGGAGNSTMYGGTGDDIYNPDNASDKVVEYAGEGYDKVYVSFTYVLPDNVEGLAMLRGTANINGTGNGLNNNLYGNDSSNALYGLAGNDTLDGGAGDDILSGGAGADAFCFSTALNASGNVDTITDFNSQEGDKINLDASIFSKLSGGVRSGNFRAGVNVRALDSDDYFLYDTATGALYYDEDGSGAKAAVKFAILANKPNLIATDFVEYVPDKVNNGDAPGKSINGTSKNDKLYGTAGDDTINGLAGNDILYGGGGNDILYGGDGDDCLDGELYPVTEFKSPNWYASVYDRAGADTMYGGYGNDYYFVDNAGDKVVEYAGQGYDRVYASVTYALPVYVEFVWLMGSADINATGNSLNNYMVGNEGKNLLNGGAGDDTLVGQGGNDTIWGGAGNDALSGGTGADVMAGGTGDDWYSVDNAGDVVIENAGEGTDKVNASVSYSLGANVENLVLSGTANINGTGNNLNNAITGNSGNNILSGLGGNDRLNGGAGNDILMGGGGNDTLTGGTGADTFVFASLRHGVDTITDFVSGQDRLQLAQAELSGLLTEMRNSGGSLSAGRFAANNTGVATNASQRIIYDLKTGALYYDADGSGSGVATQFATLGNKPANLKASDFFAAAS